MDQTLASAFVVSLALLAGAQQQEPARHDAQRETAPAAREEPALQQAGDGDAGASEEIDESQGAKPSEGPYRSPYRLRFKYPMEQLLFDAKGPRGSIGAESTACVGTTLTVRLPAPPVPADAG